MNRSALAWRAGSSAPHSARRPIRRAQSLMTMAVAGLLSGSLVGLLVFAPARWLAAALPASSPVQLSDAQGSIWRGSARLWLAGGGERTMLPQRLHWQGALNWRGPELLLQSDCCAPQGMRLSLGFDRGTPMLHLADGQSTWPAELLTGLGTPWNTLQPSGQLVLRTESLGFRLTRLGPEFAGQVSLDLLDMGSALSTLRPMGSYRLVLREGAALQLQTLRGDLLLSGQGQWASSGLKFQGEARAAPGREEALGNILNIIGKRDGARTLISLG